MVLTSAENSFQKKVFMNKYLVNLEILQIQNILKLKKIVRRAYILRVGPFSTSGSQFESVIELTHFDPKYGVTLNTFNFGSNTDQNLFLYFCYKT